MIKDWKMHKEESKQSDNKRVLEKEDNKNSEGKTKTSAVKAIKIKAKVATTKAMTLCQAVTMVQATSSFEE